MDNDQTPLPVRSTDPETSRITMRTAAYRAQQANILGLLREGPSHDQEIQANYEERFGNISPSGCRTRRNELVKQGLVKDSGARVKLPASGYRSIVWEAV